MTVVTTPLVEADTEALASPTGAARDSRSVAVWTAVSRGTGLLRVVVIGAVLGPTLLGNAYQFTNALPNLVYYGFLAGSLFSSLLVPALVRHIDAGDRAQTARIAGGFLGVAGAALLLVAPVAILLGPLLLRAAAGGQVDAALLADQDRVVRWLVLLVMPQVFCYALAATSIAVMHAARRFALAAAAPAVENIGIIGVLLASAALYGTDAARAVDAPHGQVLLLGLGTTAAVALHALLQWAGARRHAALLRPRAGWRDAEVMQVVGRSLPALAQAGLTALQMLVLLAVANRVIGGVVALQIAFNFYFLPIAIAATPVAVSLLPRLSRVHLRDDRRAAHEMVVRALASALFLCVPAAAALIVLAGPLAASVSFGLMDSTLGISLVTLSLAALAVGMLGEGTFQVATFSSYAAKDTRTPLRSALLGATVCLGLVAVAFTRSGGQVLVLLGLAYSTGQLVASWHLVRTVRRALPPCRERLLPAAVRAVTASAVMALPAWAVAHWSAGLLGAGSAARVLTVAAATGVGLLVYFGAQAVLGSPELGWFLGRRAAAPALPAARSTALSTALRTGGRWALAAAVLGVASAVGLAAAVAPLLTVVAALAVGAAVLVCWRPATAAYLLVGLTPLVAGIDRGAAIPLLRPNEALAVALAAALAVAELVRWRRGATPTIRLDGLERALLALAVTSSLLPLVWLVARGMAVTGGDLSHSLMLWKLLLVYGIVRIATRSDADIRRTLYVLLGAAAVVGLIAVLQSLGLFGVRSLLAMFYAPFGEVAPLSNSRGSSTLALPVAVADLMVFALAVAFALWRRRLLSRPVLVCTAGIFLFGTLASGQFSGVLALVIGVLVLTLVSRSRALLGWTVAAGIVAGVAMWPVIQTRLVGFQSATGLPVSWTSRIHNLQTYFWPELFSHANWVLGVRPDARAVEPAEMYGYIWIESGYTWLLWAGGIPLFTAFAVTAVAAIRRGWRLARDHVGAAGAAGEALCAAFVIVVVLMWFDPHLTYRGAGDALFVLLALARPVHQPQLREVVR
jgi:putative peptidoglycan lipid II flippase